MFLDERLSLRKRFGYARKFTTALGTGTINGMTEFIKTDGTREFIFAYGTILYKQLASAQPTTLYSGIANQQVSFFLMNSKLYVMDGVRYLVYDGTTITNVVPYAPKLTISGKPITGGGEPLEGFLN